MERHFAFFDAVTGVYVREWRGPVEAYRPRWWHGQRERDRWATRVSRPAPGEVGLDVTHIGWPVGDFCYCRFDSVDRMLDWGPPRYYIQIHDREIIANQESHRPIYGEGILDITGTALEPFHGRLFGRLTRVDGRWRLASTAPLPALAEAELDLVTLRQMGALAHE